MDNLQKIISDELVDKVWSNANFGDKMSKRDIIRYGLLKCASGYYTGFTLKNILSELGLTKNLTLTKIGRIYLYEAFSNGTSV